MKQQRVQFCDGCGKVCDDLATDNKGLRWVELRAFQMTYGFKSDDLSFVHTYCPECHECVQAGTSSAGQSSK